MLSVAYLMCFRGSGTKSQMPKSQTPKSQFFCVCVRECSRIENRVGSSDGSGSGAIRSPLPARAQKYVACFHPLLPGGKNSKFNSRALTHTNPKNLWFWSLWFRICDFVPKPLSHATARKSAEVSRRCLSWRLESFAGLTWPPALECYRRVPRQINFNVFVGVLTGREKALARYRRVPYRMESSRSTAQQQ